MTGKEQSLGSLILFFGLPFILGCEENLMGPDWVSEDPGVATVSEGQGSDQAVWPES